jgi:hypothetical protein
MRSGRSASIGAGSRPRHTDPVSVSFPTDRAGGLDGMPTKLIPREESTPTLPMLLASTSGAARRRSVLAPRVTGKGSVRRAAVAGTLGVVALVALFLISSVGVATTGRGSLESIASPSDVSASASTSAGPTALPSAGAAREGPAATPPCFNLNATICISMVNSTESNIVPPDGSHVSSAEPSSNTTLSLYIKSEYSLIWPTAHTNGPLSPIALNATGVLWNGDPYYSVVDGTVWHPTGSLWWTFGPTGTNTSYPYWYGLNLSAKSSTGVANFFPGMTLTWWVYFVSNTSGLYSHWSSIPFQFTFSGAWPYSPDPGAYQYGGPGAALQDLSVTQNPLVPNFNDSVNVTIATTSADLVPGATIGGAYLDLSEFAPDGALLDHSTISFPAGPEQTSVQLSTAFSQDPGALVQYSVTAWDTNIYGPDEIQSQTYNYTVNGNGTFASGIFSDDLGLTWTPALPDVPAGQPVQLLLSSRNLGTAIFAAEAVYTFKDASINESATGTIAFDRLNSTHFGATLPALPLGSSMSFQVLAWDFAQDRDVSTVSTYQTPTLALFDSSIPSNSTFLLVYVYDNGTHEWVTGATVEVSSVSGFVQTYATTFDGVAYPNATGQVFVPLVLPAGEGYQITVTDPTFVPSDGSVSPPVTVSLTAPHNLSQEGVLKVTSDYVVAQSGNAIYFWLNESGPGATYSATVGANGVEILAAVIGLGALALTAVPLLAWWSRIRARRTAQEKRITL